MPRSPWGNSILELDVPVLAFEVLKIDLNNLEPPENLPHISKITQNVNEFYNQFKSHIISEVIASIKASRRKLKDKAPLSVSLNSRDYVDYYSDDKVTVVTLMGENRIDCIQQAGSPRFIVSECRIQGNIHLALIDIFFRKTQVIICGDHLEHLSGTLSIKPITSLVSQNRMFSICHEQPQNPLIQSIMTATVEAWPEFSDPALQDPTLNARQKRTVLGFTSAKTGLYLLQGPPGTGKTTTVVATLKSLIQQGQRIVVCAPSNKAVQVLASRALQEMPDSLPILLVAVSQRVKDDKLKSILLDNWVDRYPRRLESLVEQCSPQLNEESDIGKFVNLLTQKKIEIHSILQTCIRFMGGCSNALLWMSEILAILDQYIKQLDIAIVEQTPIQSTITGSLTWHKQLQRQIKRFTDQLPKKPIHLINASKIVFCTLSSSGRYAMQRQFRSAGNEFDTLIIDEAGQAVQIEALIPFGLTDFKKALIVGDTRQLPATTIAHTSKEYGFDRSLMWGLVEENKAPYLRLAEQYRMRPLISQFPSQRYYDGTLINHPSIEQRPCPAGAFYGKEGSLHWIDVHGSEARYDISYHNHLEAQAALEIIKTIRSKDKTSSIGVISFYAEQVNLIDNLVQKEKAVSQKFRAAPITVNTVDGFQGDEEDMIIVSFVRANRRKDVGFLRDFRRLNVALTRAKNMLIVIGNVQTYDQSAALELHELLNYCRKGRVITSLDNFLLKLRTKLPATPAHFPAVKPISNVTAQVQPKKRSFKKPNIQEVYNHKELLDRATRYIQREKFKEAENDCRLVLEDDPKNLDAYKVLIACYQKAGNQDDARIMQSVLSTLRLGDAAWQTPNAAKPPITLPARSEALNGGFEVVKRQKNNVKKELRKARKLSDQKQYAEAEALYTQLSDDAPLDPEVFIGFGWCLHKQQKHFEAIDKFEKSLKITETVLGYYGLIQCKSFVNDFEESLSLVAEALDFFPWSNCLYKLKTRLEQLAEKVPKKFKKTGPEIHSLHPTQLTHTSEKFGLIKQENTLDHTRQPAKKAAPAIIIDKKRSINTKIAEAKYLSAALKHYDDAEKIYRELYELDHQNFEIVLGLGVVLNRQQKNQDAIEFLLEALHLKKDPFALSELVVAYKHLGEYANAQKYLKKGLSDFPGFEKLQTLNREIGWFKIKPATSIKSKKAQNEPCSTNDNAQMFEQKETVFIHPINPNKIAAASAEVSYADKAKAKQPSNNPQTSSTAIRSKNTPPQPQSSKNTSAEYRSTAKSKATFFQKPVVGGLARKNKIQEEEQPPKKKKKKTKKKKNSLGTSFDCLTIFGNSSDDSADESTIEIPSKTEKQPSNPPKNKNKHPISQKSFSNVSEFQSVIAELDAYHIEGQHQAVIDRSRQALELLEITFTKDQFNKSEYKHCKKSLLDKIIRAYTQQKNYLKVLEYILIALEHGEHTKELKKQADNLNTKAVEIYKNNDIQKAKSIFLKILAFNKKYFKENPNHIDIAKAHWSISSCCFKLQEFKACKKHTQQAYNIRKIVLGESNEITLKTVERLDTLKTKQSDKESSANISTQGHFKNPSSAPTETKEKSKQPTNRLNK